MNTSNNFDQVSRIANRCFEDIPTLKELWNPVMEAGTGVNPFSDSPFKMLLGYVKALRSTCEQTLFSIECLESFSNEEASNITEFYVQHYLYDFIARVKTSTDVIALLINLIYQLDLPEKRCSLESGNVVKQLRSRNPQSNSVEQLARKIDKVRNNWLTAFYGLRNLMIHQSGFEYLAVGGQSYPIHIQVPLPKSVPRDATFQYNPQQPLEALKPFKDEELILTFLVKIDSTSVSQYLISVDPLKLCKEIWQQVGETLDELLRECKKDVFAFLANHTLS